MNEQPQIRACSRQHEPIQCGLHPSTATSAIIGLAWLWQRTSPQNLCGASSIMHVGIPGWWSDGLIHLGKDPIMGPLIEQYGPHGLEGKGDLFNTLIRSIVGQQISVIAAESIWNRFVELVGDVQPSNVLKFSKEEIAACGITRPKSGYILGLAQSSKQLLEFPFESSSIEVIRKHLIQFKGIGPWTAEMVMIFSLCLPDIYLSLIHI